MSVEVPWGKIVGYWGKWGGDKIKGIEREFANDPLLPPSTLFLYCLVLLCIYLNDAQN